MMSTVGRRRRPRLAWFPLFVDDFRGGVCTLTVTETGCYLLLLMAQWGSKDRQVVESDFETLELICKGTRPSDRVLSKFTEIPGGLRNERLADEWSRAKEEYEGRARGGRKRSVDTDRGANRTTDRSGERAVTEANLVPNHNHNHKHNHTTDSADGVAQQPAAPARRETWLTPYCDDWTEAYGGHPPAGEMAKVLISFHNKLGLEECRKRWRLYLGSTEGRYASPTRFSQTIGVWTEEMMARARPQDIRSMTVGQFNAATYERIMARMKAKGLDAGQGTAAEGGFGPGRVFPRKAE